MELTHHQVKSMHKVLVVLTCLILILTVSAFISVNNTILQQHDSRNINTSGMQRMLSQKVALHAQQLNNASFEDSIYSKKRILAAAVRLLENHQLLVDEKTNPYLSDSIKALYFSGSKSLDHKIREFADNAILLSNGANVVQVW